jgi:hypothetical protein
MKKSMLSIAALCLMAMPVVPVYAAEKDAENADKEAASGATLDQFNFGTTVANGDISQDSVKGKVVVLEFWGIH